MGGVETPPRPGAAKVAPSTGAARVKVNSCEVERSVEVVSQVEKLLLSVLGPSRQPLCLSESNECFVKWL